MPIRFRCEKCKSLLGIARRKSDTFVQCPQCLSTVRVPTLAAQEQAGPQGVWQTQTNVSVASSTESPSQPLQGLQTQQLRIARSNSEAAQDDQPLFERGLDELFQEMNMPITVSHEPAESQPQPSTGIDAMSLDSPTDGLTLSFGQVTIVGVVVFFLVVLAFISGYLLGGK